ncbi:hypothetical protein ACWEV4_32240 [Streptomyces sp. NPDC003860]
MPLTDVTTAPSILGSDHGRGDVPVLSATQLKVVTWLSRGASRGETARMMNVSRGRVASHIRSLERVLGVVGPGPLVHATYVLLHTADAVDKMPLPILPRPPRRFTWQERMVWRAAAEYRELNAIAHATGLSRATVAQILRCLAQMTDTSTRGELITHGHAYKILTPAPPTTGPSSQSDADAEQVARALATLPPDLALDEDLLSATCALEWEQAHTALNALHDAGLIESARSMAGPERHRLTPEARARYANALSHDSAPGRRLCAWVLALVTTAYAPEYTRHPLLDTPAPPPTRPRVPKGDVAQSWLCDRPDIVTAALTVAQAAGWHDVIWQLVDALHPHFLQEHHPALWRRATVQGLAAARRSNNPRAVGRMLRSGAMARAAHQRVDEAAQWLAQLLHLALTHCDPHDEAYASYGLGLCHAHQGDHPRAQAHLVRASRIFNQLDSAYSASIAARAAGQAALNAGAPAAAIAILSQAHTHAARVDRHADAAAALAHRGHAHVRLGDTAVALPDLTAALPVLASATTPTHEALYACALRWMATALDDGRDARRAQLYREMADSVEKASPAPPGLVDDLALLL